MKIKPIPIQNLIIRIVIFIWLIRIVILIITIRNTNDTNLIAVWMSGAGELSDLPGTPRSDVDRPVQLPNKQGTNCQKKRRQIGHQIKNNHLVILLCYKSVIFHSNQGR